MAAFFVKRQIEMLEIARIRRRIFVTRFQHWLEFFFNPLRQLLDLRRGSECRNEKDRSTNQQHSEDHVSIAEFKGVTCGADRRSFRQIKHGERAVFLARAENIPADLYLF